MVPTPYFANIYLRSVNFWGKENLGRVSLKVCFWKSLGPKNGERLKRREFHQIPGLWPVAEKKPRGPISEGGWGTIC